MSWSSAPGPPGSPPPRQPPKPACRRCCSTRTPVPAARSFAPSPRRPVTDRDRLGADYWAGADLVQSVRRAAPSHPARHCLEPRPQARDRRLDRRRLGLLKARRVILATGALERPFPIPGWTLPGVMTAGAAQTMLKSSGLVPRRPHGDRGAGPAALAARRADLRLGGRIDRILDTTQRSNYLAALPHCLRLPDLALFHQGPAADARGEGEGAGVAGVTELRPPGWSAREPYLRAGASPSASRPTCCCCIRAWCPTSIWRWRPASSIAGTSGSSAVARGRRWRQHVGRRHCDRRRRRRHRRGGEPRRCAAASRRGRGEALRLAADAKLAPMATLQGGPGPGRARPRLPRRALPAAPQFRIPADDTLVCRCEEVTAKEILDAVALGAPARIR